MKKYLFTALASSASLIAWAQRETELKGKLEGIDTVISRIMKDWRVPGVSVGVVYKGTVVYARGFGYRDLQQQLPVTPNTVFPIASCTKPFTTMLVGIYAAEGKLDINRPVNSYLPQLQFYTPALTAMVTAKDMMTHRTGLPRHDWAMQASPPMPLDTIMARIPFLEPSASIREKVQYNNNMFAMLGLLTRQVSGKDWEEQLKEKILVPLEMTSTTTRFSQLGESEEYSRGYVIVADTLRAGAISTEGAHPSGSMNSTVLDMTRWLSACIENGSYKGRQVLPAAYLKEATTPQMSTPSRPNPRFPAYPDIFFGDYGYAWLISSYRGHYMVQHSGDLPLYSSNTSFFPTDSIGIVVLANKFDATVPEMISSYVADRLLDLPFKDWNKLILDMRKVPAKPNQTPVAPVTEKPVQPMELPIEGYVGTYRDKGYGSIEIKLEDGKLVALHNGKKFAFSHQSANGFRANVPGGMLSFAVDNNKKQAISISGALEEGVRDIVFIRVR
jgi:CubicO group peptidase (beta-lactamase class C family)